MLNFMQRFKKHLDLMEAEFQETHFGQGPGVNSMFKEFEGMLTSSFGTEETEDLNVIKKLQPVDDEGHYMVYEGLNESERK